LLSARFSYKDIGMLPSFPRDRLIRCFLFLLALGYTGCTSDIVPATGERRYVGFSWDEEIKLGQRASKDVAATFGIYRDPKLQRYVEDVGQRVLAKSHLRRPGTEEQFRRTPVTFQILDSPIINAMALPGGYVYVTRGMLAHLNNEDQLAVVLAHEIGHVAARHAARQSWQQQIGQGLLLGGAILGQSILGLPAQQLLSLGGAAAQLLFLRYSREDELEADSLGVEYSSLAGYDAQQVSDFFRSLARIQEKEGQGLPNFLSTHPDPGDRVARIRQLAAKERTRSMPPEDITRYLTAVEGIVFGEDPRQGFVEENVFYHPDQRFQFPVPRGFRVVNQPTQVVMVEDKQRAMLGFSAAGERSLDGAVAKFVQQPGLRVLERTRRRSGELPAMAVVADAKMENGKAARILAYFVQYRDEVYYFMGYTSPELFRSFEAPFLQTMVGFKEIRDPRMLQRQPVRVELLRVDRSAPFRTFIPAKLPAEIKAEDLAILNQLTVSQEVGSGKILKLPKL
jgi:predicted Zn-dependent protease